jgi:hypothetical protein
VAPTFVPPADADWPVIVWASAKLSLAGAAPATDGSTKIMAVAAIAANIAG